MDVKDARYRSHDFPELKKLKIVPLGDTHVGPHVVDYRLIKKVIKYIQKTPNTIGILMGDMFDNPTLAAAFRRTTDIYDHQLSPQEQLNVLFEMLLPIKDRLILGYHDGQHELRTKDSTGLHPTKILCKMLGIPYNGWAIFQKVRVGNENYIIYSTHGATGATTPEGKIRRIRKLSENFLAEIYLYGHTHDLLYESDEARQVNLRNKHVETIKRHYINTGHYINYEGSYAERKNYGLGKKGAPIITLYGDKHRVDVDLETLASE